MPTMSYHLVVTCTFRKVDLDMKRIPSITAAILVILLIISGCQSEEEASNNEEDETGIEEDENDEEAIEQDVKEEAEPVYDQTYPLTGIGTNEDVDYRAFGVMIENSQSARPHSGLYQADIVYEVLAEGSITRLLAIFHSQQPERIGNVRSARDYYIYLNNGLNAIYASAGGSPGAFDLIEQRAVDFISGLVYDGTYFTRSSDRNAPHNMYTTFANLVEAAEQIGYDTSLKPPELPFTEELELTEGTDVTEFEIDYGSSSNNVQYSYDRENKVYVRSVGGQLVNDSETNDPVAPKNVFIVETEHRVIDDQGRRHIDIESGGNAYLIQEGVLQEVEWRNVDGVLLPYKDGDSLSLLPGQTFINLVPTNNGGIESRVSIPANANAGS